MKWEEGESLAADTARILDRIEEGRSGARDELFQLVYTELHRRAEALMRRQRRGHTLQPTELIGEVYLRMFRDGAGRWTDRKHFLLAASRAMKHALIDHARRKATAKRNGERSTSPLDELVVEYESRAHDLEALQSATQRLELLDPDMAKAIELRFFGGSSAEEAAGVLGMSLRTFQRRWQMTRAWLFEEIR